MSKTETKRENKLRPLSYGNLEVKAMIKELLAEAKIKYIALRVSNKEIVVEQAGHHESAGALASLFELPGVFGFDEDTEDGSETVTRFVEEFGVVVRTVNTFNRYAAAPLYEKEKPAAEDAASETEAKDPEPEATPVPESPEDILKLKVPQLDELLEANDIDPAEVGNKEAKQKLLTETMFVSLD